MKRTITDCDSCGKQDCEARSVRAFTGKMVDGPTGVEKEYLNMDLCIDCLGKIVGALVVSDGEVICKLMKKKG
jgi:hypothetical protein